MDVRSFRESADRQHLCAAELPRGAVSGPPMRGFPHRRRVLGRRGSWAALRSTSGSSSRGPYVADRSLLYYNDGVSPEIAGEKIPVGCDRTGTEDPGTRSRVELRRSGYAHIHLHHRSSVQDLRPFLARLMAGLRPSYTYVVPLGRLHRAVGPASIRNLRRLIARCERDGVTYREDRDFDALFQLQ